MRPWIKTAAVAASAAAVLAAGLWWFHYIPDDAYIGMRYARNLAGGEGLVFNPGERVEGYTNFLWVILLAAAARAGLPVVAGARVLSLLFSAGTIVLTWLTCLRAAAGEKNRTGAGAAGAIFIAAAVPMAVWALSGTEIPMFTFLLTAGIFLLMGGSRSISVFTVFALLTLTRPEGAVYYLLAGILMASGRGGRTTRPGRVLLEGAAVAALLIAPYVIWKLAYFGSLLPNTFYAKTGAGTVQLRNGLSYAARFAAWYAWVPAGALFLAGSRRAWTTVPLSFTGLNWLTAALLGGDWMPHFRLLVFTLPAIAVLAGGAVPRALELAGPGTGRRSDSWQAAALAVILACVAMAPGTSGYDRFTRERRMVRAHGWVGEALGAGLPEGTVIACGSTGAIGWYSGLPVIDILGLTEPEIARGGKIVSNEPGHMRSLGSYVLDREPDLLLLGNIQIHRGRRQEDLGRIKVQERDIVLDPRFSSEYLFVNFPLGDGFFLSCYARRGSAPVSGAAGGSSR